MKNRIYFSALILNLLLFTANAQFVTVGSGSYTTTFPGTDVAGRNAYPSGTPYLSGNALGKPVPTSDWWSALIKNGTASNLFNYPYTMKTIPAGLVVSYIPLGVIDDLIPFSVGVTGLSASNTTVSDYSDWTVTMHWSDATHEFQATSGVGMPLLYTSTLNGKNYWSMAFIPLTVTIIASVATEYKKYAYVFPVKTTATYSYNESTSVLHTDYTVENEEKEGNETYMLLGLLPHQWGHLAANSPIPDKLDTGILSKR